VSKVDAYNAELARFRAAFGANVRRVRNAKRPRCSQERLSYLTRLHRTEIGRIEQGAVEPRLSTLVILADGLGVGVEELIGGLWVPQERKPAPNGQSWS
jgi:transcriptional regulator with XRE-family HTH domain